MKASHVLLTLPCLLAAQAAAAQTAYPQMAYTQISGKSQLVYVANLDGTRAVRVATGSGLVTGVDLSPVQGKLAFTDSEGLKILSFTTTATSLEVQGVELRVAGPYVSFPDFTPDGSGLLYHQGGSPSSFRLVPVSAGAPVTICQCAGSGPRWLAPSAEGDRFVFQRIFASPTRAELWSGLIAADGTVSLALEFSTVSLPFYEIRDFDVSRTRNAVLMSANYGEALGNRIIEYNLDSDLITQWEARGTRVHYSAGDASIVFVTPHAASGDYVSAFNTANGTTVRLTKKGDYNATDARP